MRVRESALPTLTLTSLHSSSFLLSGRYCLARNLERYEAGCRRLKTWAVAEEEAAADVDVEASGCWADMFTSGLSKESKVKKRRQVWTGDHNFLFPHADPTLIKW